ncbi:MAG: hypothetical protein KC586_14860, partial [Myxococcales bacterium]|nr:hypothetical protein [Myxococcales bacterium]
MQRAAEFVRDAYAMRDEAKRKTFVRAHVHGLPRSEVESALIAALEDRGWQVGLLMVALRTLQVVPSERLLHYLMAMVSEGASYVPGGARLRGWLDGHVKSLIGKQDVLAEAAKRYRRPEWAKPPSQRKPEESPVEPEAVVAWRAATSIAPAATKTAATKTAATKKAAPKKAATKKA